MTNNSSPIHSEQCELQLICTFLWQVTIKATHYGSDQNEVKHIKNQPLLKVLSSDWNSPINCMLQLFHTC